MSPESLAVAKEIGTLATYVEQLQELRAWRADAGRDTPISIAFGSFGTLLSAPFAAHVLDSVIAYLEAEIEARV